MKSRKDSFSKPNSEHSENNKLKKGEDNEGAGGCLELIRLSSGELCDLNGFMAISESIWLQDG